MEILNKTVKKLTDQQYEQLIIAVSGKRQSKPFEVLEAARNHNYDEQKMMEVLNVNPSTYYTLKSRLNQKVAAFLSRNMENPISFLKNEVARVPAMLYTNDREVAIRALKELEKQLLEYDLSNELIVVYKALARLNMFLPDYDMYERLYNKHVAFSLAVAKAEDLFYDFCQRMGRYLLSREEMDLEAVKAIDRELANIFELYDSHRLKVLFNIVRFYTLCTLPTKREALKSLELEIDNILTDIRSIFDTYELDTFYQNIKFMVDFIYFEFYQKTKNAVRADYYYNTINPKVPELAARPLHAFYVSQFLNSKLERFLQNNDITQLTDINEELATNFDIDENEHYHLINHSRFQAICKFYQGDFTSSAKIINNLRNGMMIKKYQYADVECKLFQALSYCLVGEDGLCTQIMQSIKRQIAAGDQGYECADIFIRMLKTAQKPEEFRKKVKRITELWDEFNQKNSPVDGLLWFLRMDDSMLRRLANPIK